MLVGYEYNFNRPEIKSLNKIYVNILRSNTILLWFVTNVFLYLFNIVNIFKCVHRFRDVTRNRKFTQTNFE